MRSTVSSHAAVVEVDAVARDVADREQVAGLEVPLGGARAVAEQRVVAVEAVEQRERDRARRVVGGRRGCRRRYGRGRERGTARDGQVERFADEAS